MNLFISWDMTGSEDVGPDRALQHIGKTILRKTGAERMPDLDGWEIWSIPDIYQSRTWSARPSGARTAVICGAASLDTIEEKISEYMRDLDEHVAGARRALDALPAHYRGEREVQEALINALARLSLTHRRTHTSAP